MLGFYLVISTWIKVTIEKKMYEAWLYFKVQTENDLRKITP